MKSYTRVLPVMAVVSLGFLVQAQTTEDRLRRVEDALRNKANASQLRTLEDNLANKADASRVKTVEDGLGNKADAKSVQQLRKGVDGGFGAIEQKLNVQGLNINRFWVLLAALLVFFMQAGFKCLEVGMVGARFGTLQALYKLAAWIATLTGFYFSFGLSMFCRRGILMLSF